MPSNLPMIGLRLPLALKQAAERTAAADHRSLSNWLVVLIEREVSKMVAQLKRVSPLGRLDLIRLDASANPPAAMSPYLAVDTRDGSLAIGFRHQCDNAVPMNVWHRIVRRLEIPCSADGEDLTTAINAGEIDALIGRIVMGSAVVWDGSNHVGNSNEDAANALKELQTWLDDFGGAITGGLWDAADWLQMSTAADLGITATTTDAQLNAIEARLDDEAQGEDVVLYRTYETLERLRQELRNADA